MISIIYQLCDAKYVWTVKNQSTGALANQLCYRYIAIIMLKVKIKI